MPRYKQKGLFQIGEFWIDRRPDTPALYKFWYDPKLKRTRHSSLGTTDLQEAIDILTEWYLKERRPKRAEPEDVSLNLVLLNYYNDHARHIASAEQAMIACAHLNAFFEMDKVGDLDLDRQEAYARHRREQGASDGTISREMSVVRAALNRAHKRGELRSVPHIMDFGKGDPRERRLSQDEMRALLEASEGHLLVFVLVAANTLARPGAVTDLQVFQCDFENRLVHLNPHGRKQTKKYRAVVPMTETIYPILQAAKGPHIVQFHGRSIASVKHGFATACKRAGIKGAAPGTIRHTMATELRKRAVPGWEVSGWLGHKQQGTTEIYAKFDPDYLGKGRQAIDAYFAELGLRFDPVSTQITA